MTDKDPQLDEIERRAVQSDWQSIGRELFEPGGVYYEMRRENERLMKLIKASHIKHGNCPNACTACHARRKLSDIAGAYSGGGP